MRSPSSSSMIGWGGGGGSGGSNSSGSILLFLFFWSSARVVGAFEVVGGRASAAEVSSTGCSPYYKFTGPRSFRVVVCSRFEDLMSSSVRCVFVFEGHRVSCEARALRFAAGTAAPRGLPQALLRPLPNPLESSGRLRTRLVGRASVRHSRLENRESLLAAYSSQRDSVTSPLT